MTYEATQPEKGAATSGPSQEKGDGLARLSSSPRDASPQKDLGSANALAPSIPVQVLKVFASIVAPLSLLTALMFYFGLLHAHWFFGGFGVDYTVFELTTQDYLLRSADGLFVPLTAVAAVGLAVLWTYRLLPVRFALERRVSAARMAVPVAAGLGSMLLAIAVIGVADPALLQNYLALPGLALSTGVLLLLAASRMQRWRTLQSAGPTGRKVGPFAVVAAEWAAVFLLVSVGLFWAVGDWSAAVGVRRGNQVLDNLSNWPDVVLYTEKSLNLKVPGVRELACSRDEAAHAFRYDGLHLIVQSGGQYLFLPDGWTPQSGSAIVIPKTDGLRLEFTAPGISRTGAC